MKEIILYFISVLMAGNLGALIFMLFTDDNNKGGKPESNQRSYKINGNEIPEKILNNIYNNCKSHSDEVYFKLIKELIGVDLESVKIGYGSELRKTISDALTKAVNDENYE